MINTLGHKLIIGQPYYHTLHGKNEPFILEGVFGAHSHVKRFGKNGAVSWFDNNYLVPHKRIGNRYLGVKKHG